MIFIKEKKKKGDRTKPCGTPLLIREEEEVSIVIYGSGPIEKTLDKLDNRLRSKEENSRDRSLEFRDIPFPIKTF